jgi:hypothetical protein
MVGCWDPAENCSSGFLHPCELGCGGQRIQLSFHRYLLQNLISDLFVMETFGLSAKDKRTPELSVVLYVTIVCRMCYSNIIMQLDTKAMLKKENDYTKLTSLHSSVGAKPFLRSTWMLISGEIEMYHTIR